MDVESYLLGKKAGGGTPVSLQDKEITITTNGETEITADSGYTGLGKVDLTTNVPQPSGKITITQNGTDIDVSSYASADVSVKYTPYYITFKSCPRNNLDYEVANMDTINLTNLSIMFDSCTNLTSLDLRNWRVDNVTTMSGLFSGCVKLETVNLSGWNTVNNEKTDSMFANCKTITTINLPNFVTSNVTTTALMFSGCQNLISVNLSGWNTSNVTSMGQMFSGCKHLTTLDLSSFYTPNLTKAYQMFVNCLDLTHIDMRNMDLTGITTYANMFGATASGGVPDNCEIIVADATQKQWLNTNFSRLTNVKTVAEINE